MAAKKDEEVVIKPLDMQTVDIRIIGDTPLIIHNWSEKARRELLKLTPALTKKVPRNPWAEGVATLWWMNPEENPLPKCSDEEFDQWVERYKDYGFEDFQRDTIGKRFGFPAAGIKKASISSSFRNELSKNKVSLQGAFFIKGEGENQLVEIKHEGIPLIREDPVRVQGSSDMRYRCTFPEWYMDLKVTYNANGKLKLQDIVTIINLGGQTNGIGEWRIEKGGSYGSFHVQPNQIKEKK